jgi:hypothetical protein
MNNSASAKKTIVAFHIGVIQSTMFILREAIVKESIIEQ